MPRLHASKLGIACGTTRRLKRCDVIRELHRLGDELRSVVGPDVSGNAPQDEEVGQNVDHVDRLELAGDTCLWETFSPSRCQIHSTRLSLIVQPAWRSSSVDLAIAIRLIAEQAR
jgi:hypothetical protein